jgi:sulfur carrier protein ThiS
MKVNLKCFSKLVDPGTCEFSDSTAYDLDDGHTVKDLVERAGIDREEVKIAFVNSRIVGLDAPLEEGDQVGLAPAIGGM